MKETYLFIDDDPFRIIVVKYYPECGKYYYNVYDGEHYIFSNFQRARLANLVRTFGFPKTARVFHTTEQDLYTRVLKGMRFK